MSTEAAIDPLIKHMEARCEVWKEGLRNRPPPPTMETDTSFQAFLASKPKEQPCHFHPEVVLVLLVEDTWAEWKSCSEHYREFACDSLLKFQQCPKCREERIRQRLRSAGVPDVLLECSLDNWTAGNDEERQHLEAVRTFAMEVRRGFLVLLGPVGIGKSHLAVAVARKFQHLLFVKQSTLLRQLRATYSDKKAADPIERCQEAELLVLDEMGVSGGGKDEWPMLSEILDHRYGHLLPTVITSNLGWDELRAELGDRLGDRLRESAHAVLVFAGESRRPAHRASYFGASGEPAEARAMRTFMGQQ